MLKKPIVTSFDMTASTACGAFLYGTCTRLVPVARPNNTPDRWWLVPLPPDENVNAPGFDFATAMMSATVDAVLLGCTTITLDARPSNAIGAKSVKEL